MKFSAEEIAHMEAERAGEVHLLPLGMRRQIAEQMRVMNDAYERHDALAAALDPVGEGSEGAEAAVEAPSSAATPVRRVPSHDDGRKDARETR